MSYFILVNLDCINEGVYNLVGDRLELICNVFYGIMGEKGCIMCNLKIYLLYFLFL